MTIGRVYQTTACEVTIFTHAWESMKKLPSEPDMLESSTRAQIKAEIKASKMRYTAKRSEHAEGRNKQRFDSDHSAKNSNFTDSGEV